MPLVFLTGATGFLGTHICREMLQRPEISLAILVRAGDEAEARRRLQRAWWDYPELAAEIGRRVAAHAGDITQPRLGLSPAVYDDLAQTVDCIIHAAADLRLHAPLAELRRTNVTGTQHLLALAQAALGRSGAFRRFTYVSTAYVAGRRQGLVAEDALTDAYGFASNYERSKYEAERLVRQAGAAPAHLPVTIVRPGMVVGHSRTGMVKTFNTIYFPLRLYFTGHLRLLPVHPDLRVNMVPVDYVAQATARLTLDPAAAGITCHLTAPQAALPTVADLLAAGRAWAADHLHLRLPRPIFLPVSLPAATDPAARSTSGKLRNLAGYFRERRTYDRSNTDRLCGQYTLRWQDMLPSMLAYAVRCGFLHRSERTVHEQIVYRLSGKSRPVALGDIAGGQIRWRRPAELRQEIETALAALRAFHIGAGDAVAIVGHNTTRYAALDTAIGLAGAVSVPLYYTSPLADIAATVQDSQARLLLVGAPALLPIWHQLGGRLPVVSFCAETAPPGIVTWEQFLERGRQAGVGIAAPQYARQAGVGISAPQYTKQAGPAAPALVGPDDPATIRYTSGTTGQPKQVVFTHRQLRWMAETVAALPPWPARRSPVRYLSFLPLSHVVEGILGAYAPYYAPAPVTLGYLPDFSGLAAALPALRPTFFFSVPRFYEKFQEKVCRSWLGRLYGAAARHRLGRLLRPLVKSSALRRAGLDRCTYMVVGSAPVSPELLAWSHDLGIPVHNAYGLTEAPLISINRPGRILPGTAGELLPETEVRTSTAGEILVRGPQVAATAVDDAGWLHSGDLGHMTAAGGLVLTGRQKEFIITAYGKNINPFRVEVMLRAIPGMREALLIGDNRPFCTALLWVDAAGAADWPMVDGAVEAVNARLSRPEQVKRWAILPYDLSPATGELTANLKLRRTVAVARFAAVIDHLYREVYGDDPAELPVRLLHLGQTSAT